MLLRVAAGVVLSGFGLLDSEWDDEIYPEHKDIREGWQMGQYLLTIYCVVAESCSMGTGPSADDSNMYSR
jgi:hypothetical protein